MRTDSLIVNAEDMGEVVGEFYGTPVRTFNPIMSEVREMSDAQQRVRYFLGSEFPAIEVLPGEAIVDNLVRRETTAEVVGQQFYEIKMPEGRQVPVTDAVNETLVTWRPGNQDFAVIHEEVADELPA